MKIVIKDGNTHITLRIPNIILLSKGVCKALLQGDKFNVKSAEISIDESAGKNVEPLSMSSRRHIYNAVRSYIRKNGHFTLVEVTGSDGESVKITI